MSARIVATVSEWDIERGYGRATCARGYLRVHHRDLPDGHGDLIVGERIECREEETERGWCAREVRYVDREHAASSQATASIATLGDLPRLREVARSTRFPIAHTRAELIASGQLRPAKESR